MPLVILRMKRTTDLVFGTKLRGWMRGRILQDVGATELGRGRLVDQSDKTRKSLFQTGNLCLEYSRGREVNIGTELEK
jgi:hypothetical protein